MPASHVLQWKDGAGWLVLSGGGDTRDTEPIDAQVQTRAAADGPLAYIWAAGDYDRAIRYMDYLAEMGGRPGYLVDLASEDNITLERKLAESGLIVLGDGPHIDALLAGLAGPAQRGMQTAFSFGATIVGIGAGGAVLGSLVLTSPPEQTPRHGLEWVKNAVIAPGIKSLDEESRLIQLLRDNPQAYALGIGIGSALVLGPSGEIELWGRREVTISLGPAWGAL